MRRTPRPYEGLYVHIPFCTPRKCAYCDFYSVVGCPEMYARFLDALKTELHRHIVGLMSRTIFVGGGTPTSLDDLGFFMLFDMLAPISSLGVEEFTVEANPNSLSRSKLEIMRSFGVNRLSIGIQSFSEDGLQTLGRSHARADAIAAVKAALEAGFNNISIDLISDIPGLSSNDWLEDLEIAAKCGASHISCYSLSYEEGTPLTERMRRGEVSPLGEEESALRMLQTGRFLADRGFHRYEVSNFAATGRFSKHNSIYWRNGTYLGLGPSAVSFDGVTRRANVASFDDYCEAIEAGAQPIESSEVLSDRQFAGETAILMLRRTEGITFSEFLTVTGYDVLRHFFEVISRLELRGLLVVEGDRVRVPEHQLPLLDMISAEFLEV